MNDRIENTILNSLFFNEDFTRKALPFIKPQFFTKRKQPTSRVFKNWSSIHYYYG